MASSWAAMKSGRWVLVACTVLSLLAALGAYAHLGTAAAQVAPAVAQWRDRTRTARPSVPAKRPVDPAPQRILVIGDSMVHNLLPTLADYSLENGHELIVAIWWGSTSMGWGAGNKLDQLVLQHDPTYVIVVLGSSEIISRDIDPLATAAVRKIEQRLGGRRMVWIGPPNWRPDTGINATLERELGPRFFRSAELVLDREADGIHPTPKGGAAWAEHIVRWIADVSSAPIALRTPTRKATPPRPLIYPPPYKVPKPS